MFGMPLFGKKKKDEDIENNLDSSNLERTGNQMSPNKAGSNNLNKSPKDTSPNRPHLVFYCQQAQGSPTGIISGFASIKELYQKISECYDFNPSEILFCTLNTHKVDMDKLLGSQIGLEDFIFVHRKGQAKEVELTKSNEYLGLTITDNGTGHAFIKRIKEGSLMDGINFIQVGDHIEKINGQLMVGSRHFDVAKTLKDIPKGAVFTMRIIEPLKAGFSHIGPRSGYGNKKTNSYGSGRETLRLRAKGPATVEEAPDDIVQAAVEKVNSLLEGYMGISDSELAMQIWDLGNSRKNPHDFAMAVDDSDLEAFGFSDEFIMDLWGAIGDAKTGRLVSGGKCSL